MAASPSVRKSKVGLKDVSWPCRGTNNGDAVMISWPLAAAAEEGCVHICTNQSASLVVITIQVFAGEARFQRAFNSSVSPAHNFQLDKYCKIF